MPVQFNNHLVACQARDQHRADQALVSRRRKVNDGVNLLGLVGGQLSKVVQALACIALQFFQEHFF